MIDFKKQFEAGVKAAQEISIKGNFDRVIFCGVGGSAMPSEVISMLWLKELNCYINRSYGLPHWTTDDKNLIICTSWSGNTQETISSFKLATEKNLPIIAITRGGELAELAENHHIPLIKLPNEDLKSRFATGYMLSALLTTLSNSAIIDYMLPISSLFEPIADSISSKITGKMPLIYSSYQWRYLARFWKIHFNEDCKIHSFSNYLPEAVHNEIAGFNKTKKDSYFPIILIDPDDQPEEISKLKKFASFLKNQEIDHEVINIQGNTRLEKILNNYNLAISTSLELAKVMGVDPLDTSVIEEFKKA